MSSLELKSSVEPIKPPRAANIGGGCKLDFDVVIVGIGRGVAGSEVCWHGEVREGDLVVQNAAEAVADKVDCDAKFHRGDETQEVEVPDPVASKRCDLLLSAIHWNVWVQSQDPALDIHKVARQAHDGEEKDVLHPNEEARDKVKFESMAMIERENSSEKLGVDGQEGQVLDIRVPVKRVGKDVMCIVRSLPPLA